MAIVRRPAATEPVALMGRDQMLLAQKAAVLKVHASAVRPVRMARARHGRMGHVLPGMEIVPTGIVRRAKVVFALVEASAPPVL